MVPPAVPWVGCRRPARGKVAQQGLASDVGLWGEAGSVLVTSLSGARGVSEPRGTGAARDGAEATAPTASGDGCTGGHEGTAVCMAVGWQWQRDVLATARAVSMGVRCQQECAGLA